MRIEGKDVALEDIEKNYFEIYLVTARHVLITENGLHNEINLRMNRKNQEPILLPYKIEKSSVYKHKDKSVDLICCICNPNNSEFDYIWIPTIYLVDNNTMRNKIEIGNEIIHLGLFANYVGKERNHPIFRFGRLSTLDDEKIEINSYNEPIELANLYLAEIQSYPGNSGSPVFVQLPRIQPPPKISFYDQETFLLGILKGHYNDIRL